MQILLHELKKIFSWKILLLLLLINTILYFLLIEFEIKYFPNGRPDLDLYRVGVEMVEKYGTRIDDHEFADFEKIYEEKKKKQAGIYSRGKNLSMQGWERTMHFAITIVITKNKRNYMMKLFLKKGSTYFGNLKLESI